MILKTGILKDLHLQKIVTKIDEFKEFDYFRKILRKVFKETTFHQDNCKDEKNTYTGNSTAIKIKFNLQILQFLYYPFHSCCLLLLSEPD